MSIIELIERRANRAHAEAHGLTLIEDLSPAEQKAIHDDMEAKARYVRTAAGVARFKRPIGAIILPRGIGSLDRIRIKDPVFKGFDLVEDRKGNLYDVGKDDSTGKYVALKHNTWDDQVEPQDSLDKALEALNTKLGGGTNSDREEGEKPAPKSKKPAPKETPKETPSSDKKPQGDAPSKGNTSTAEIVDGKFVITTPDGKKHTRTATGKKPYTHALIRKNKEGSGSDSYFVSFASDEGKVRRESRVGAANRSHNEIIELPTSGKDSAAPEPQGDAPSKASKGAPGSKERDAFIESHPKIKDVDDYHKPKLRDLSEKNFEAYVAAVDGGKSPNSVGPIMNRIDAGASWNPTTEKWVGQNSTKRPTSPTPTGDTSASDAADAAVRDRVQKMKDADRSKGRTNPYTSSLKPHQKDEVDALTPGEYATYMNARDDGHGHQGAVHRAKNQPKYTYLGALRDVDDAITNAKKNLSSKQTPEEQEYELKNRQKRLQEANAELGRHRAALPQKLDQMTSEQKAQEKEILAKYQAIDEAENAILRKRRAVMKKREDQAGQRDRDAAQNQKNREARESAEAAGKFGNTATFVSKNQDLLKEVVTLGRSGKSPAPHLPEVRERLAEIDKRLAWSNDELGGYHKGKGKAESDERAEQFRKTLQSQRERYQKAVDLIESQSKPKTREEAQEAERQARAKREAELEADRETMRQHEAANFERAPFRRASNTFRVNEKLLREKNEPERIRNNRLKAMEESIKEREMRLATERYSGNLFERDRTSYQASIDRDKKILEETRAKEASRSKDKPSSSDAPKHTSAFMDTPISTSRDVANEIRDIQDHAKNASHIRREDTARERMKDIDKGIEILKKLQDDKDGPMTARQRRDADTAIKYAQDVKKRLEARFSGDGESSPVTAPDEASDRLRALKETQKGIAQLRKTTKFQADQYDAAKTAEGKKQYANALRQRQAKLSEYQAEIEERSKGLDLSDSDRTGLKRAQNALKRAQEDIDYVLKQEKGRQRTQAEQSTSRVAEDAARNQEHRARAERVESQEALRRKYNQNHDSHQGRMYPGIRGHARGEIQRAQDLNKKGESLQPVLEEMANIRRGAEAIMASDSYWVGQKQRDEAADAIALLDQAMPYIEKLERERGAGQSQSTSSDAPKSPAYDRGARLMDTSKVRQRSDGKWNVMPGALPSDLTNLSDEDLRFLEGGGMTDDFKQTFVFGIEDSNRLSGERQRRGRAASEAREAEESAKQAAEIQRQNGNVTWNPDLTPAQKGRLDKHLAREYRYEDGIHTTREEYGKTTGKRITAGEHFLVYEDGSSIKVPKIVYDAAQFPDAPRTSRGARTPRGGSIDHQRDNTRAQRTADDILHEVQIGRFEKDQNVSFGRGRSAEAVRRDFVRGGRNRLDSAQDALRRIRPESLTPAEREERSKTLGDMEKARRILDQIESGMSSGDLRREVLKDESGNLPFLEAFQDVGGIIGQAQSMEELDRGERALNDLAKRPDARPSVIDTARAILDQKRREMTPAPTLERVKGADSTVSLAKMQALKARRARTEKSARDHINVLNGAERDLNRTLERSGDRMPADQRAEVEQALQEVRAARAKAEQNIPLSQRTTLRPSDIPALNEQNSQNRDYREVARNRATAEAQELFNSLPTSIPDGTRYGAQELDRAALANMDDAPSVPALNRAIRALEEQEDTTVDDEIRVLKEARDYLKERADRDRAEFESANTSLFGDDLSIPEPTPARPQNRAYTERPGDPGDGPFRRGASKLRGRGIEDFTPNEARRVDEMDATQWRDARRALDTGWSLSDILAGKHDPANRDRRTFEQRHQEAVERRDRNRTSATAEWGTSTRTSLPQSGGQESDDPIRRAVERGEISTREADRRRRRAERERQAEQGRRINEFLDRERANNPAPSAPEAPRPAAPSRSEINALKERADRALRPFNSFRPGTATAQERTELRRVRNALVKQLREYDAAGGGAGRMGIEIQLHQVRRALSGS